MNILHNRLKELKEWLKNNGRTQKHFAKDIGVSYAMISQYLNGNHKPSTKPAQRIYDITGIITNIDIEINE